MPCVRNFGGAYLNTRGGWVVLPHLLLMETPQTLKQHEQLEYTQGELRKYNPSHGGIYDEDMVRAGYGAVFPDFVTDKQCGDSSSRTGFQVHGPQPH
jgi:hypothetical protein